MMTVAQGNCGNYFDFYANQANPNSPNVSAKVQTCSPYAINITSEPQYSFSTFFAPTSTASSIALTIPSNGQVTNDLNYWTVHYVAATSSANLFARVIYYDAYGFYRVDTSAPVAPNSELVMNLAKTNALAPHEYLAQAQLIHDDGINPVQILAQSGWNTFTIVLPDYGATIASTTSKIQGGFFDLQNCADPTVSSSTLSEITCNVLNSFKSLGNTIFSNVQLIVGDVGSIFKGVFPFNVFTHLADDFKAPSSLSSSTVLTIPYPTGNITIVGSSTIQSSADNIGFSNYRTLIDYILYAITAVAMAAVAILAVTILRD
jgi:hypothetical protein